MFKKLRLLRIYMFLTELPYWKQIRSNRKFYKKYGINRKLWQGVSYHSITNRSDELPWLDRMDKITDDADLLKWSREGYMIKEKFIDEGLINKINNTVLPQPGRMQDLWRKNKFIEHVFNDKRLIELLSSILGKEVIPFQSINFIHGSGQAAHSDSIHMTTEPFGYMIAVWIALEDIQEGSGELMYYPGSHKLPFISNQDYHHGNTKWSIHPDHYTRYEQKIKEVIEKNQLRQQTFLPKIGDMLIWHANLLHGGMPITRPELTRKSMVFHYYAKDVLCYAERTEKLNLFQKLRAMMA